MVRKARPRLPRLLLIYCEGKTEKAYFDALLDVHRPPRYVDVCVFGQEGQHRALIDRVCDRRACICAEDGLSEQEVECWAVCDNDNMPLTYVELESYAEEHGVHLAFSDPQFEVYLLQHFEQSGESNMGKVFAALSKYRNQNGGEGDYSKETKSDLAWMAHAMDMRPKIVKIAITNSDLRNRPLHKPFLTVQNLTRRIVEMGLK